MARTARTSLPPGFRFHPTDIELVMYYLKRKILGKKLHFEAIAELNIYKFSPWDLPDKSYLKSKDLEWYFFCPRERKYACGERMKRGTETGYWKTTGKDRIVAYNGRVVGMVKTLVFHEGSAPRGKRTDWVVHEYRMHDKYLSDAGVAQDAYVLYKVFKKNGPGPKNGAQYGAPFNEEEWDDDSGTPFDSLPSDSFSPIMHTASENENSSTLKGLIGPVCTSGISLSEAGPSSVQPSNKAVLDALNNCMVTEMFDPQSTSGWALTEQGLSSAGPSANDVPYSPNDDIAHLLEAFTEDSTFHPNEEVNCEHGKLDHGRDAVPFPPVDGNDPFDDLEDLSNWDKLSGAGVNFSGGQGNNINDLLLQDNRAFLELNDLDAPLNFSVDSVRFENIPTGSSYPACNPDASEHILTGMLSTQYSSSGDLVQICCDVNFPSSQTGFLGLNDVSLFPNSADRHVDSTSVFLTGTAYENIFSQGYAAGYNLHSISYSLPEEFRDAAGNQERGVQKRKLFSMLQQLLESFPVHTASVAEHLAPSNSAYGGSFLHIKAEVTCRFGACTKDALSIMLGESTYDYSCWWNLHGAEFWKNAADCSSCSVVFYFGLKSAFLLVLMFSLSSVIGCRSWNCISCSNMIACFNCCSKPMMYEIMNQFYLGTNPFFLLMLHWLAICVVLQILLNG